MPRLGFEHELNTGTAGTSCSYMAVSMKEQSYYLGSTVDHDIWKLPVLRAVVHVSYQPKGHESYLRA